MRTVKVKASSEYDVLIGEGLLDRAGEHIVDVAGGDMAAVVTDDIVAGLYLDRLLATLRGAGYETAVFTVKNGEASKNVYTYVRLLDFLASSGLTRSDIVVALGGGVVGDLAGFAAATYMRGVQYVQIPTTILAAVDSSVGGKTGVDLEAGKNLAGSFYQPKLVICDHSLLEMLPPRIFTDGCGEVIKYGMIADKELFYILGNSSRLDLGEIITRCVTIKRDIVCKDEYETGMRKLLNFGHTIGHAVERLSKYGISHGKAVAIGMAVETKTAARMGICGEECYQKLVNLLHKYGLPCSPGYSADELARAALSDKKRRGGKITLVFPQSIGKCTLRDIDIGDLKGIIELGL